MQRLLELLKAKGHIVLFCLIEIVAILLLIRGSNYHNSVFLSSSNVVVGKLTEVTTAADAYIGLKRANAELLQRNADLQKEVLGLKSQIERLTIDTLVYQRLVRDTTSTPFPYDYIAARVVGNSLFSKSNYLTINKGWADGIRPDMGVVSIQGVVGVVSAVGAHYAKVIPLINNHFSVSCKLVSKGPFGDLHWDGVDYEHTLLTHLPKHLEYSIGDTVCTSGYSAIFPEGVYVGVVTEEVTSSDDNFYTLRVKLNTDFSRLKNVFVIKNYMRSELDSLRNKSPRDLISPVAP